jgi:DNA (cytosine-5)-methyltransferase 1
MINVGSDFSGVGAFNQALDRLNINYKTVFACDWDKYARQTYIHNYGEPDYYPSDVYDRKIPKNPLDIYMTSPPCQAFSLAGKRKGEKDKRGVLFYNSHEFIVKNKPRYFIFENVKGLKSDAKGRTFQVWLDMLGGKSVNGNPVIFPREDATPYHIYHKVLNAKNYGVPQNRERVFIIGIRDDADNNFHWPKAIPLVKRLKDVLEKEVDKKFYLSESNIDALLVYNNRQLENGNGFSAKFRDTDTTDTMDSLKVGGGGKDD